jgi:hypothetical protein
MTLVDVIFLTACLVLSRNLVIINIYLNCPLGQWEKRKEEELVGGGGVVKELNVSHKYEIGSSLSVV